MVIDRGPATLAMVRRAVADHYDVVARDAEEPLGLVDRMGPRRWCSTPASRVATSRS